ncbi:MAG: glycosyltransferase family 4 protein [Ruminococcaceae bacterium]|nr:glycosyltransferase family 4 protein [Oscillospiraceae bacterium]
MNILFAAGDFDKQLHATNKIVYNVAQSLAQKGHRCIFAGLSNFDDACTENKDGLKLVRINSSHICDRAFLSLENFVRSSGLAREQAKKKFYFAHPVYTAALLYRYNIGKKELYCADSYAKQLKQLADREKADMIVVSYMPFIQNFALVTQNKWDIPVIAWQLDPWGLHRADIMQPLAAQHTEQETSLFEKCRQIITTPVLYRQYSQHPSYSRYLDKMVPLDFPNVKKLPEHNPQDCVFSFDKDIVNLLFCGIVHDDYRNPQFLLDSLSAVRKSGCDRFKLHFLGSNESDSLRRFMTENDWVVHHGNVPLEKAFATMEQADVLINIGNTYDNQVPSKIFDYFAFGKPIINVEKIHNCPAREYISRYPCSVTLEEWNSSCDSTSALCQFLADCKGSHTAFEEVEKLFYNCTLNYATDVFCDIIDKI